MVSFGDGALQLQRAGSTNLMILYDFRKAPSSSVIDTIKAYKKKKQAAYLIGVKYFIFIDTAQNTFTLYEGLDRVPPGMRAEFESLK
ncbi:hypothetical protein [Paenibacillus sp. DYY-L-2]|uniref:hypothetical protein n=1 Tax=Paenibacillus sp. DYY-L-2 TaxID=3447013 RepID=UPI003F507409